MNDTLLKRAFLTDGIGSLATAAVLILDAHLLTEPLGLSSSFLTITGWLLIPCAALFFSIARTGSRPLGTFGVIGNLAWVLASAVAIPILQPTTLGGWVIAIQALLVLGIAWFEWRGLQRLRTAVA